MTEMGVIPYSFNGITEYPRSQQLPAIPGQAQGVYIILTSTDFQFILNKMIGWFSERDEVKLVDFGASDKLGRGYIMLEWTECEVDPLFLAILRDEETVADYTVYTRDL